LQFEKNSDRALQGGNLGDIRKYANEHKRSTNALRAISFREAACLGLLRGAQRSAVGAAWWDSLADARECIEVEEVGAGMSDPAA
jgi:hypothetical protein